MTHPASGVSASPDALAERILAAITRNNSKRPARAADVFAQLGGTEADFWAALEGLLRNTRIHTAHIQRPAQGDTAPWLAIWPTGVCLPAPAWSASRMSSLFVRHDSAALKKAHSPRSRPRGRARRAKEAA